MPALPDDAGQISHPLEHRHKFPVFCYFFRILILQDLIHTGITHPLVHMDHRLCDLMICYMSGWIHPHDTAKRQPVLSCVQRTDPIRQCMGQHGDHPVYQIHTGSPLIGFPVQCTVFLYIVGHICDMNAQDIVFALLYHRNRIIKILGILAVDGHHLPVP